MRRVLLAVLLLTPATVGCLDGGVFEDLRKDLEARDEYEEQTLLVETVHFTPTGIADPNGSIQGPDDVSQRWNQTVTVPEGTRSVTVTFKINFTNPEAPGLLPEQPPDGEVRVYIDPPGPDNQRNLTRTKPATAGFDFPAPDAGPWQVGMNARGNGTVAFTLRAVVPIVPQAGT